MRQQGEAGRKRGLSIHAIVFVLTMVLLAVINLMTGSPYWVFWIALAWSIGLFAHWWFISGPGQRKTHGETP
jgi:Flp pilus assembly protein TadB